MFELQTVPAPEGLAALGERVELRELTYGELRRTMATADRAQAGEALLAASLYVDGAPLGLDALQALPGRFAGGIARALERTLALHGMGVTAPAEDTDEASAAEPSEASAPGEA
jgi:hypothetical protein